MGASRRRGADRALRPRMRSPGRPPVGRREHRQRFWGEIARGVSSEEAAVAAGVSPQRVAHQLGRHAERHRPAHDATAPSVQNHGKLTATRPDGHVRDVGHPQLVRTLGLEVPGSPSHERTGPSRPSGSWPSSSASASRPGCPSAAPPALGPPARPGPRAPRWIRGRP